MTYPDLHPLFTPVDLGELRLGNRVAMAPLTRLRAAADGTPNRLMKEYYAQRASFGLIIAEGTWPVQEGKTWIGQPGIANEEHIAAWREITDAVHERGGKIIMQVMHGGRVSHGEITGTGRVVAPSALATPTPQYLPSGKADAPVPHALTLEEIPEIIEQYVVGARNAMAAGMDGVQVHGANGYLIHQFLAPSSNTRTDSYGGSPENRARFAVEVVTAVAEAIGAEDTGLRLSPARDIQGVEERDPDDVSATYRAVADGVADLGLAHIEMVHPEPEGELVQGIREASGAPLIVNTGFDRFTSRDTALEVVGERTAEAVAVGRLALANPDLVERWREDAPLNEPDKTTFYGGGARGYTDYPVLHRA